MKPPTSAPLFLASAFCLASLMGCSHASAPSQPAVPPTSVKAPAVAPSAAVVPQPANVQPDPAASSGSELPQLVFYMNPRGAPCQAQDRVLRSLEAEFEGKVQLVYRDVTVPQDRAAFMQAGIRGLPSLVLYDASGAEIARATPGVQDADHVRALLTSR